MELLQISRHPLFAGVENVNAALASLGARRAAYPKGSPVLHMGDGARNSASCFAGSAGIVREDAGGNPVTVAQIGAGELFAEAFALSGEPLSVSRHPRRRKRRRCGCPRAACFRGESRASAPTPCASPRAKTCSSTSASGTSPAAASRRRCSPTCAPPARRRGSAPFPCPSAGRSLPIIWAATAAPSLPCSLN